MGTRTRPGRRLAVVLGLTVFVLGLAAASAYGGLGTFDTATGTGALANEAGGNDNTADGYNALNQNVTGIGNTAVGSGAGTFAGPSPNTFGVDNTYLGHNAGPASNAQLSDATAIGANATVNESHTIILGPAGTHVGIDTQAPASLLQVGTGAQADYPDGYIQVPLVQSSQPPPLGACDNPVLFGRMVIQYNKKKVTLWVCTPLQKWVKV
jgi:hypothetical protein